MSEVRKYLAIGTLVLKLMRQNPVFLTGIRLSTNSYSFNKFCINFHVWDQSGIVSKVSRYENKSVLVNVAISVILWLLTRFETIDNSVFAIKLTMPKNSWQSFKFLLIIHHSLILKYFHLNKVISNQFSNVFYVWNSYKLNDLQKQKGTYEIQVSTIFSKRHLYIFDSFENSKPD